MTYVLERYVMFTSLSLSLSETRTHTQRHKLTSIVSSSYSTLSFLIIFIKNARLVGLFLKNSFSVQNELHYALFMYWPQTEECQYSCGNTPGTCVFIIPHYCYMISNMKSFHHTFICCNEGFCSIRIVVYQKIGENSANSNNTRLLV